MINLQNVNFSYKTELTDDIMESDTAAGSLTDLNLTINSGEFVLLTGPSGCGKTTILRLLNGLIPNYYPGTLKGKVEVDNEDPSNQELYETATKIGTVFQNPKSQFFNVDTTSELAFGCENRGMDPDKIKQRINSTVTSFKIDYLLNRNIFKLSGGEKQKIACASVDVSSPDIILLDEPSANLDFEATLQLQQVMKLWKDEGKTIIVAEHRLSYLWEILDRVILMKSGKIIKDLSHHSHLKLTQTTIENMGLRSTIIEKPSSITLDTRKNEDNQLILKNGSFGYKQSLFEKKKNNQDVLHFSNLELNSDKITAIVGSNGSGKTTLLNCICGLEKNFKGTIIFNKKVLNRQARQALTFMVMQDTNHQLFTDSVLEEVMISFPKETQNSKEIDADHILKKLDLLEFKERHPVTLSGGQKQRLAIACAVASGRKILLFDEPTSGLDYRNMKETAKLLIELKEMGMTVIVVTHDSELIHLCCDNKIVLENGDAVGFEKPK